VLDWTPAERRGVAVVALLLAIGTAYDLVRDHGRTPAPAPDTSAPRASSLTGGAGSASMDVGTPGRAGASSIEGGAGAPEPARLVDLNRATAAELDALPGIGPVLAGRIVAYRETHGAYRAVEDLLDVPGIGPTLLERLRGRVRIGPPAAGSTAAPGTGR
jgi:competence ComEA-like helix-hairpin-helix protein